MKTCFTLPTSLLSSLESMFVHHIKLKEGHSEGARGREGNKPSEVKMTSILKAVRRGTGKVLQRNKK